MWLAYRTFVYVLYCTPDKSVAQRRTPKKIWKRADILDCHLPVLSILIPIVEQWYIYVPRGELKQGKVHTHTEEAGGNWWNPPLKRGADDRMGGGGSSKNILQEEQMSSISIHFPNFFLLVKKMANERIAGPNRRVYLTFILYICQQVEAP